MQNSKSLRPPTEAHGETKPAGVAGRLSRASTPKSLRSSSTRRVSEPDFDPHTFTTELVERAERELRTDVVDMVQAAFEAFAVDPPSPRKVNQQLHRGGTATESTKGALSRLSTRNHERGVPFEDIPSFLDALGCYSHPDMMTEEIFLQLGIMYLHSPVEYQEQELTKQMEVVAPEGAGGGHWHLPVVGYRKMLALVWHFLVEAEISQDNMRSAFTTFDMDGDGTLRSGELKQVTNSLGSGSPISAESLLGIFDRLDADKSGTIHLSEFMSFFSSHEIMQALEPLLANPDQLAGAVKAEPDAPGASEHKHHHRHRHHRDGNAQGEAADKEDTLLEVEPHSDEGSDAHAPVAAHCVGSAAQPTAVHPAVHGSLPRVAVEGGRAAGTTTAGAHSAACHVAGTGGGAVVPQEGDGNGHVVVSVAAQQDEEAEAEEQQQQQQHPAGRPVEPSLALGLDRVEQAHSAGADDNVTDL